MMRPRPAPLPTSSSSVRRAGFVASLVAACASLGALPAQAQNPVYRANRGFYTSMWTANPPEYTATGQSVAAGTMHWRAFLDAANQRFEPRQITGIGTWWQPSDLTGAFPQTIPTPEFRFYPTTLDASNLVIPDLTGAPLLTVAPTPIPVPSGSAFMSVTVALPATPINAADFAICGVYPQGASSTTSGFFGFLPSGANEAYTLTQSYYGFAYPGGPITHFARGGARSSIWYTEAQPTLNLRANWAITDAHHLANHLGSAFGDQTYFSPITDPAWPGWADSRAATRLAWTVYSQGRDGDVPLTLLNFGPRFAGGIPFFGQWFELDITSPVLDLLVTLAPAIANGQSQASVALFAGPQPALLGTYVGLECLMLDPFAFQFSGTTQSAWVRL